MGDKGVDPFDLVYSGKKKPQIIEPNNPQDCHESIDPAGNNFSNSASLYLLPSPKLEEMSQIKAKGTYKNAQDGLICITLWLPISLATQVIDLLPL